MSLIGALNVGQSALTISQAQLQVTGNNITNSGDPNYSEETAVSSPNADQPIAGNLFVGTGATLTAIQRQIDTSLNERLNSSISDNEAASVSQQWSGQIESVFNALGSNSLDTQINGFLNDWSDLANAPTDSSKRQIVLTDGQSLAQQFNGLAGQLQTLTTQAGQQLNTVTASANQLAQQVANLNQQIALSQGGAAGSNDGLLDQRDAAVQNLSKLINVQAVDQGNGMVNLYVGSEPLVLGTNNRGLKVVQSGANGQPTYQLQFQADNGPVSATSGQLSAMLGAQQQAAGVLGQLNTLANGFMTGMNELHASGQGTEGYSSVTSANQVLDPTAALNNSAATGLSTSPVNGSFVVSVKSTLTGVSFATLIPVNLSGTGPQTSLNSLATSLSAIPNVSASVVGGKLQINSTNSSEQIYFSQDTSNALTALGINTFYTGSSAQTMAVNSNIASNVNLIAAAQNGQTGDNQNALAISSMASAPQATLAGQSVLANYQSMIDDIAQTSSSATSSAASTLDIRNALTAQQQAVSGVSIDEETVNMMKQQLTYQGAARLISTVSQLMQSLLQMA